MSQLIHRYLLVAALCAAALIGGWVGYKLHPASAELDESSSVSEKTTVIHRKADGSSVERTTERNKTTDKKAVPVAKPKWSVGAHVNANAAKLQDYYWSADLARRVSDTNLWVVVGGSEKKEVSLGLRIDF